MSTLIIEDLVWPELAAEIQNVKLALVPVGSCEQHGPNTTFYTDSGRADAYCKRLAERLGNKVASFPVVNYGMSLHHMGFPGTVTLRVETYIALLKDIGLAISKHGIPKIIFLSGHGGNYHACDCACTALKQDYGIEAYWSGIGSSIANGGFPATKTGKLFGHADEVETSSTMGLCPQYVRENRVKGEVHDSMLTNRRFITGGAAWDWKKDASENGALGDARLADPEIGRQMTEQSLDYMEKLIEEIIAR